MITFITRLRVRPENAAAFEVVITEVRAHVAAHEPGVLYYDYARDADDSSSYVVIEVYRDEAAHQAHMASDWVKSSLPKTVALIEDGKFFIQQFVSPGTLPIRPRVKPPASD